MSRLELARKLAIARLAAVEYDYAPGYGPTPKFIRAMIEASIKDANEICAKEQAPE